MRTLLQTIRQYDREQRAYIRELEEENERLRRRELDLTNQLASYVATVDRMKLDLILDGALVHLSTRQPVPEETTPGGTT